MRGLRFYPICKQKKLPAVDSWMPEEDARCLGQKQKEMYYLQHSKPHEHKHIWCQFFQPQFLHSDMKKDRWHLHSSGLHSRRGTRSLGSTHWACLTPSSGGRSSSTFQGRTQNCALFWKQINVSSKAVCCINILGKIIQNKGIHLYS